MSEEDFKTYIDFGASKIRIGIFDKNFSRLVFFSEKKWLSTFNSKHLNLDESKKILHDLILSAEKKIGNYIKNINLMFDPQDLDSIDLSIKSNLENKKINIKEIKLLLQESRHLILKYYFDKKIMHTIVEKYVTDEKEFYTIPKDEIKSNFLILETKFLCYSKKTFDYINNYFKENHINIKHFFCSSYAKSLEYNKYFENYEIFFFLDIGYEKSCISIFDKKRLIHFYSTPLGGNHITKDISKVLKISEKESEDLKQSFNRTETVFSDVSEGGSVSFDLIKNQVQKKISSDILNKIIYARLDEIFNLSLKRIDFSTVIFDKKNSILVLTGDGSKILNKNSIYLEDRFNFFNEISFFEESTESICYAGFNFLNNANLYEVSFMTKEPKKRGFFEKLFHLFR